MAGRRLSRAAQEVRRRMGREVGAERLGDSVGLRVAEDVVGSREGLPEVLRRAMPQDDFPLFTDDLLEEVAKQKASVRKALLKALQDQERVRCGASCHYWLDHRLHPAMAYAFTQDRRPIYTCRICAEGAGDTSLWEFSEERVLIHAQESHGYDIESTPKDTLFAHFVRVPTTRPFPTRLLDAYAAEVVDLLLHDKYVAIPKSRDTMGTWMCATTMGWMAGHERGRELLIQSETGPKAQETLDRVYRVVREQPRFLWPPGKLGKPSQGASRSGEWRIESLDNLVLGLAQGPNQVRYWHPAVFWQDEAAFQPLAHEAYAAIQPAIMQGGRVWLLSSAAPGFFQTIVEDRAA